MAVVGAGPAGLTVAYYLALEGIKVDIFEELPVNGGEVAVGVPEYRMPISKYQKDIDLVLGMEAVSITNNCRVDAEKLRELDRRLWMASIFLGFLETRLFLKKGSRKPKKWRNPHNIGGWDYLGEA